MPHVIVKLWPGRTEDQKKQMTSEIVKAIKSTIDVVESSISVAIQEVPEEKWTEEVYKPDIIGKEHLLYKKPGHRCI
ncbi:MAG: 4-oxalocrotonate tautomerase [Actinobacteria bacterium RBG_13_35_12]|nr:MAG: 4-oxalocrotonate tautomerase [Actinobacteria bacterium RBG_13_35_12]